MLDMGRTRYSPNERERMVTLFIDTAREIMDAEGLEQVSIRKVAKSAGYNSATMYLYFRDVDELITMAAMSYLSEYIRALGEEQSERRTARDTYMNTWRLFCRYSFLYPQVFHRIFFYPHSTPLEETIARYYEIYPHQLDSIGGAVNLMLRRGALESRDYAVLRPMVEEHAIGEKEAGFVSEMAVGYFRRLLDEKRRQGREADDEELTKRQMDALDFLLDGAMAG